MPVYTLKPGHARTFLLGAARRPGEAVAIASPGALSPADREALAAHFNLAPGSVPAQANGPAPARLANGLTEEQARAKLRGAGAPVADNLAGKPLADLFDAVFSAGGTDAPGDAVPPKDAVPTPDAASGEAPADSADTPPKAAPPKAARGKPQ